MIFLAVQTFRSDNSETKPSPPDENRIGRNKSYNPSNLSRAEYTHVNQIHTHTRTNRGLFQGPLADVSTITPSASTTVVAFPLLSDLTQIPCTLIKFLPKTHTATKDRFLEIPPLPPVFAADFQHSSDDTV